MPITVSRPPGPSLPHDAAIWEVRLTAIDGRAYPSGWDRRCPVYRFESNAAAEAFVRLKTESVCSTGQGGQIELRAVAFEQA